LASFLAIPRSGADCPADQPALPIDDEDGRRSPHPVTRTADLTALVNQHWRHVAALRDRSADLLGIFSDVNEEDFQALAAKVLVELLDGG
jgi:hypothetical protein